MNPSETLLLVLAVVAVLLVVVLAAAARRKKRTNDLRGTFGPEYDRTVESSDKRKDAERELAERARPATSSSTSGRCPQPAASAT